MPRKLVIDSQEVSDETDAWVVAEIGHNHQGSMDKAKELFVRAKECGVNAVKLQKRDNRALYTKAMYYKPYDNENSFGPTYGAHREALELGREEYFELQRFAKTLGLTFFATAFDLPSVDVLADLGVPALKIASADLRTLPLLQYAARVGVPIMLSTGAGELKDVQRALDAVLPVNPAVCVMQCTAVYPAESNELDLGVITTYRQLFPDLVVGYSGHDNGIAMPIVAYTLGARVIEKHFTLNRAMKGTDHAFSLEPVGMRKMVRDLRRVRVAMGDGVKKLYPSELPALSKMGKKIVAARDLPAGHVLRAADLALKSPGDGLAPYRLDELVGRTVREPLMADDALSFDFLDEQAERAESTPRAALEEGVS